MAEIVDVAPGLWLWRVPHPEWSPPWDPLANSFRVRTGDEVMLIDPLDPGPEAGEVWERLDAAPPTSVALLTPLHIRGVDRFVARYGATVYGPRLFLRDDIPTSEVVAIETGSQLPGGATVVHDGRDRHETPLWLAPQRTLVFGDDVRGTPDGLRIWDTPWFRQRTLPAMEALLELPFERVLTAHGPPVHDRAAFLAALDGEPSSNAEQAALAERR